LLVWHGRNSYKRSAKLAQFVIHRGLIISVCQTMYSIAIKFEPEGLYKVCVSFRCAGRHYTYMVVGLVDGRLRYSLHHGACLLPCSR
jgi:hypothetical protein